MSPIGLVVILSLVGIGLSWNQPSACQVRPLTCGSTSTIESELKQIRESLETGQTALIEVLGVIADRLQDIPTTMEPTTELPTHGCPGDGWRQVVFLNMTDPTQDCPSGLQLTNYTIRSCGRISTGVNICDSVTFPVSGPQYSEVCGKATAYQFGYSLGFHGYNGGGQTIDSQYLDGLSFTRGSPREHIWSFTAGLYTGTVDNGNNIFRCPCAGGGASPPFVANDYFCDSITTTDNWNDGAFRPNNILWDGIDSAASCYDEPNVPWFAKELSNTTSGDIKMRLCFNNQATSSDIALQELEIYVR